MSALPSRPAPVKITAVSTILIRLPFTKAGPPMMFGGKPWDTMPILFLRVDTDEGITGWGEPFGYPAITAVRTVIETLVAPNLIGRDPTDIAGLTLELQRKLHPFGRNGGAMCAISAADIALWDIAGKRAGLPLHQLIGGARTDTLETYASLLRYGTPGLVGEAVSQALGRGHRLIKLHEIGLAEVAAARAAAGPEVEIMLDTNCPWSAEEAVRMAHALEPHRLHWLEEPVWPPEDYDALARVRATGMTVAAGENVAGVVAFRHMFEKGAVDVAQPGVTRCGGLSETLKVVALAEAFGVRLVPHCAQFGPGYLASLHLTAALATVTPIELLYADLEASPYPEFTTAQAGRVPVPQGPGLGCEPDAAILKRFRSDD